MKTTKEMSQYAYAIKCGVTASTIYNRVGRGKLILNENGLVPKGTLIIKKLTLGRPAFCEK